MDFCKTYLCFTIILTILPFSSCRSLINTITPNQALQDGDLLISTRNIFALGFFSPRNSLNRYVGIWYHQIPEQTIVWIANRDDPLNDSSGVLAIDSRGGLTLFGNKNRSSSFWSTNVSISVPNNSMAKLLDVGNLVLLRNNTAQSLLWQSFDHPTDTMLPFMKLGSNRVTGLNNIFTSWKSMDDPGTGNYSLWLDPSGYPQIFLSQGRTPRWRGGSWNGYRWSGVPQMTQTFIFNDTFVNNENEVSYQSDLRNDSILARQVVDESGIVYLSMWRNGQWLRFLSAPTETCDTYGFCGPNGICDPVNMDGFECACLPMFDPKSLKNWLLRDGSDGCVRKLQKNGTCGNGEGFVKFEGVKIPDTSKARVNLSLSLKLCEEECLRNCTCTAYSSATLSGDMIGCLTWHGDLMDARTYSNSGQDFYVRVDSITLAKYLKKSENSSITKIGKLGTGLSSFAILLFLVLAYCWQKRRTKVQEQRKRYVFTNPNIYFDDISGKDEFDENANSELPLFDLNTIATATNNFSISNKLGEGGFGPVYKGMLYDGKEIAVKRLSKNSGQGIAEFKNEVLVIAKLQHRNLVRILGCCVEGVEKMLIYEYLPNKSLDVFIFDNEKRKLLDWRKRFDIISGVARGLMYLHHDSRLRIIHRDLKTSNVLLDANLNPKISDFGMARIFGGDEIEVNTNRVVGTYGYMSPQYAMEGRFSIKSDVYSFGVMILEIITGKKNTSYYHNNLHSNLVAHVWDLWKEGRALEMMDSSIDEAFGGSALRCITVGFLCVQEYAIDRPTMSEVVLMLSNEANLPNPKQPAFILKRNSSLNTGLSTSDGLNSINDVTCTVVEAR
ncbi:hypothetical protein CsatB_022823 [Cannabis sativa]